jgi:WS/DGAT/MGAT family acyltransferase
MPERLTALDASFLYLETPAMHMHLAGVTILDPSTRPDGPLRFGEIRRLLESRIHLVPRLRKKVLMVPGQVALPVWVDDASFDLGYHLRRAALPSPGGRRELADHVQRVLSRPLDRSKPLWELSVIEGLEGGYVAMLFKAHHAMIDGISAIQLGTALYDLDPAASVGPEPEPWRPEPEPTPADLVREGLQEQVTRSLAALTSAAERFLSSPAVSALQASVVASGVRAIVDLGPRPPSSLDVEIGPIRRFAMTEAPLQRFRDVKEALGGTVNDVVLAVAAGALHRLLKRRGEPTRGRTLRAMVPVSVRHPEDEMGNRVAPAFVDLPIGAMSPKTRLARVREGTRHLKGSMMAMSADAIIGLGSYGPGAMLAAAAHLAAHAPAFNLVVSNTPAPQQPMYMAGARLVANYPSMPIGRTSALSIACTSLGGTMAFGLTGDWDGMPDLDVLADAMDDSLTELSKAAGV